MTANSSEEKFDRSLYKLLLFKDQEIIDEYAPKMSVGEINSFMQRFIEHYPLETVKEIFEVNEDTDSVVVFENSNISKTDSLNNFIGNFISSTKSPEDINLFFADDKNFYYVTQNSKFYKNSSQVFCHITKYFRLSKSLRPFLEDQKELDSFIWEGFRAYFENKRLYRGDIYAYIGSLVNRKLRQGLELGFICPFCSTYYIRDNLDKNNLINCSKCQNRFSFAGVKCPTNGCNKIVPITSIDTKSFNKDDAKHIRAFRALNQYLNQDDIEYIADLLCISEPIDTYKIPISTKLHKNKIKKLVEYNLSDDAATSVPEFLFYLPLVCPITSGHTKAKHTISGHKYDAFKGCGNRFLLKDGLRKALKDNYFVYRLYDQQRIRYNDINRNRETYNDGLLFEYNENTNENKIPYDRIIQTLNKYFAKLKLTRNKPMLYLSKAINKYFIEEYDKSVDLAIETYLHNLTKDDLQYIRNFDSYIADTQLQNNLYYKNSPAYRLGWIPDNNMQEHIRELYIGFVQNEEECVRKIIDVELPLNFYTYRISKIHNRPITYKKRIGIAIDKTVLPAVKRSAAGYGQNFKMDKKFITVKLTHGSETVDLTSFVKNGVYWSPENATLHGFDSKTGIIWFDGSEIEDKKWKFPNGFVIGDDSMAVINIICTTDSFSKMFQRFDLNSKMREIASELETEGYI